MRRLAVLLMLVLSVFAFGGDRFKLPPLKGNLYFEGATGRAIVPFLGSEDPRWGRHFGVGLYLPGVRRFRYRHFVPELVVQAFYQRSTSPGVDQDPVNGTDAYGVLALNRYMSSRVAGVGGFFEWGLGLHYADMRTVDLSGRLSFTPTIGFGVSIQSGTKELLIGARLMHISNAGLQGNNQGNNYLLLMAGVRF